MMRSLSAALVALMLTLFLVGPTAASNEGHLDGIIAIVNDEPITYHELRAAIAPYRAQAQATGTSLTNKSNGEIAEEVLEGLIDDRLLLDESKRMGLDVPRGQVDQHMERLKQSNGWGDPELESAVMASGFDSLGDFRAHLEDEYLRNQLLSIKVLSRIKIDPKEVERVYAKEVEAGRIEERRAQHILRKLDPYATDGTVAETRGALNAIKARIEAGETTFEAMAREHSEDPTGPAGGDLGWFSKGSLDPSFEAVVFSLNEGSVSEPVRTPFGLHLIRVIGVRKRALTDASQKKEIMSQIRFRLRSLEQERLYKQWIETLRDQAFIEIRR